MDAYSSNKFFLKNSEFQKITIDALLHSKPCLNVDDCINDWLNNVEFSNDTITVGSANIWSSITTVVKDKPFNYNQTTRFVICLGLQLSALAKINYGFTHLVPDDITVVDNGWYLITNFDNISTMNNEKINVTMPFSTNIFTAPELEKIVDLPVDIDHKSSYYSIGMICLYILGLTVDELKKLYPSPLYYFIERCIADEPSKRSYLLI